MRKQDEERKEADEAEKLHQKVEALEAQLHGEKQEREEVVALVEELLAIQANAVPPAGLAGADEERRPESANSARTQMSD